jgi:YebC/PmpR family DNA-binding regulatory protein
MSGHNRWSKIQHKKGAADAKRSKVWTKIIKEITVAARIGGGDPNGNPRLRAAILSAKAANMPNDTQDRAIKKGTGELEGVSYEELVYEGYGPKGVALLVEVMTDSRNRTTPEIRHIFEKHSGALGASGSVAWMFKKRGYIALEKSVGSEDQVMEKALDLGADDVRTTKDGYEILTEPSDLEKVREGLEKGGWKPQQAEVMAMPQNTIQLEGREAEVMLKLMGSLEDHDDVQHVWANFDIDDQLLEQLSA